MIDKKYFHIGFHFSVSNLAQELELIFNEQADDWIRYNENCWIVYTKLSSEDLFKSFKSKLKTNDNALILEITQNQNISGWLPQWIWTWLYKQR